jgi:signal transduction histidine kinase
VLRAIAHAAAGLLNTTTVAAFSLAPSADAAEVLLVNAAGAVLDISDLPLRVPEVQPDPVLAVGADLEPLMASVGPRLPEAGRFWAPLTAETGTCVGGVVWGAPAGEIDRLAPQRAELLALSHGWALALCTAQVRDASRRLAEQLADANRQLVAAQEEVARGRAMRAVAEMAAGAGHEMNNPLAIIVGRAEMLVSQLAADPKLQKSAGVIVEQGNRLSGIITDLMDFARPAPPVAQSMLVKDLIPAALARAKQHDDWADRTVVTSVPPNAILPPVRVDGHQASAILAEVIANAVQATDAKNGRVTVTAGWTPGSTHVAVSVTDNGCGMDEPTARRAFDPFFSGRPAGRRRGLGLAKALRWAEAVGGTIRLDSRVGHGTTAVVLWPVATAVSPAAAGEPPRRAAGNSA